MQYTLPLEDTSRLAEVHRRLTAAYGPQPEAFRPDPVTQLIWTMMGTRTRGEVSEKAFLNLRCRFTWEQLPQTPSREIQELIKDVTYPEKYAEFLPGALQAIILRRGRLSLDFLRAWPEETAQSWLEKLPGVGPKASAAVLNFSRLHRRALVVDTHHLRVACRLGLIPPTTDLEKASRLLTRQIPDAWTADDTEEHHWLMKRLGQDYCHHARPECAPCPLRSICPEAGRRFAPSEGRFRGSHLPTRHPGRPVRADPGSRGDPGRPRALDSGSPLRSGRNDGIRQQHLQFLHRLKPGHHASKARAACITSPKSKRAFASSDSDGQRL